MVISLDAGYRGDAENFQPERQLIRRLLYSPTGIAAATKQIHDGVGAAPGPKMGSECNY